MLTLRAPPELTKVHYFWLRAHKPESKKDSHASTCDGQQNKTNRCPDLNFTFHWAPNVGPRFNFLMMYLCADIFLPIEHEEGKGVAD